MELKFVENREELEGILAIQAENLFENASEDRKSNKGFVLVKHTIEMLETMNNKAPQIIATEDGNIAGFALVMPREFKDLIPTLVPMFETFETINYEGHNLTDLNFYVMGQICVADAYKRQGLFKRLYNKHKEELSYKYDYCVTEVSSSNGPSMHAHKSVGFKTIHTFRDETDEWNIMLWDWK